MKKPIHPIRAWRDKSGMKQNFLAARVLVTPQMISSVELWRVTPSVSVARRIATFTGLSLEDVLRAKPDA